MDKWLHSFPQSTLGLGNKSVQAPLFFALGNVAAAARLINTQQHTKSQHLYCVYERDFQQTHNNHIQQLVNKDFIDNCP